MALTTLEVALQTLARAGLDFLVVGVGGINFYAPTPADAVVTQDLDVLLRPDVETRDLQGHERHQRALYGVVFPNSRWVSARDIEKHSERQGKYTSDVALRCR